MGNVYTMSPAPATNVAQQNEAEMKLPVDNKQSQPQYIHSHSTVEYDEFRDGYTRYLGYTNEIGEAFRRHISRSLYLASYAIATTYVCADTVHKANRSIQRGESTPQVLLNAGDAFIWQMFASIIVPGYVINRITYLTRRLIRLKRKKCICKASPIVRFSPVAIGLLAIPFVIHPIDNSVSWAMDNTIRKLYSKQGTDDQDDTKRR